MDACAVARLIEREACRRFLAGVAETFLEDGNMTAAGIVSALTIALTDDTVTLYRIGIQLDRNSDGVRITEATARQAREAYRAMAAPRGDGAGG